MIELTETQQEMLTEEEQGWFPCGYPANELLCRLAEERIERNVAQETVVALSVVGQERDKARAEIKDLRELAYNYLDFTPNCGDNNKCYTCGKQWYPNECSISCLHAMLFKATREAKDSSIVWLELCDKLEEAQETSTGYANDLEIAEEKLARMEYFLGELRDMTYRAPETFPTNEVATYAHQLGVEADSILCEIEK